MMKMRRWAVIKWAARASSEQGATSMTEVEEQFDYLDNIKEQFDYLYNIEEQYDYLDNIKEQYDYLDDIEEQYDYLDNMLKTSLHPETIPNHSYPSQTCHH